MNKKFIQSSLLKWFKRHQRPLPWRKKYEPYHVWISEIMLQQTQVKTVLPYFERWILALPDIRSVARAKEDKILKLWEGLGYYSRARNLQKAARMIVKKFVGKFPRKYEDILSLPGIGRYTAAAITSIAFNQNYPVVDGNVIRMVARLFNDKRNTRLPSVVADYWKRAGDFLPKGRARDFNQAMMELGALVCTPNNPDCDICPLQKECLGYKKGTMLSLPNRGKKTKIKIIDVVLAVIRKGDKVFIQKRPPTGLMAGLWEFPGGKIQQGETPQSALRREIMEEMGITIKNLRPIMKIRHAYTRFKVNLHCFLAEMDKGKIHLSFAQKGEWVRLQDLRKYPFPAADVRLILELPKLSWTFFGPENFDITLIT